jgi:abortive infection bacteriophage resistance protein
LEAPQGGFFLSKIPYPKPARSLDDQVALLRGRGMTIADPEKAKHYLKFISYYRLSAYSRHYLDPTDANGERFLSGCTFDQVLELYIFDRKLRVLLTDALERIEVAVKASLVLHVSMAKGPFWFTDPANFDRGRHESILEEIEKACGGIRGGQHLFITHFRSKYSENLPPSWMISETLSFGVVSRIVDWMKGVLQSTIAADFKVNRTIMVSWLHALAYARNMCAHHCIVWNRHFTIVPVLPEKYPNWPTLDQKRLYITCAIIQHFMKVIADESIWSERLRGLMSGRPGIPLAPMGFPDDWERHPFWAF